MKSLKIKICSMFIIFILILQQMFPIVSLALSIFDDPNLVSYDEPKYYIMKEIYNEIVYHVRYNWLTNEVESVSIKGYEGTSERITIPSNLNGTIIKSVTIDGNSTLKTIDMQGMTEDLNILNCTALEQINICDTVKTLNINNCELLKEVIMPDSVEDYEIFKGCSSLEKVKFGKGITEIKSETFNWNSCDNLITVELPDTIKIIGDSAFRDCTNLENINLPNFLEKLGNYAFYNCKKLKKIKLPKTTSVIGDYCFGGYCIGLEEINLSDGLTEIGDHAFEYCTNLKNVTIPDGIREIGTNLFIGCENLQTVNLPTNLTSIPDGMFDDCISLTNINIPDNITSIGNSAFRNCTSLPWTNLQLPNNIVNIGNYAFYKTQITEIKIPNGVAELNNGVFQACNNLSKVELSDKLTRIGSYALACQNLTSIQIPSTVTTIDSNAFFGCDSLQNIKVPEGVTRIEENTFYGCNNLKDVKLPKSLEYIGSNAFMNCSSLSMITIYGNVTQIESNAFQWSGLNVIYGYKGTYAETFANEKGIEFRALDGIWVSSSGNVPNNYYRLTILGRNKEILRNIEVKINNDTYICEDGIVAFDKEQYDTNISVTIIYEGEEYIIENYQLNEEGKDYIKIPTSKYDLLSVKANGHDVLTSSKILQLSMVDNIEFEFQTLKPDNKEIWFQIYQEGTWVASQKRNASTTLVEVPTSKLEKGKKIEIRVVDSNYDILSSKTLNLSLIKIDELNYMSEIKFENKLELSLPDTMGPLAGLNIEIPFEEETSYFTTEMTDEKIKIGFSTKKLNLSEKEFEKEIQDLLKNNNKFSKKDEVYFQISAYTETTFDNGILIENKAIGALIIVVNSETSYDTLMWSIPVTFKASTSLEGKIEIELDVDWENGSEISLGEINAALKGELKVNAGIGTSSIASAGIYGKIETLLNLGIIPDLRFQKFEISGEAGIYAEILGAEFTSPIIEPNKKLICDENFNWYTENSNAKTVAMTMLYDISAYNSSARNIAVNKLSWNNNQEQSDNILLGDEMYTYTNQKIVTANNDTLMIFLDNDILRDDYNFKTLKYSIYNKETKTWSEPIKLDNNNTQDNCFMAYADGTNIYVIYAEEKELLNEYSTIEDYAKNQEITVAKWNSESEKFESITTLTNNNTYDMLPQIAVIDNIPVAIWVNNESNSPFGTTNDNSILYSKYENNNWTTPKNIASQCNCITDVAIGKIGDENYIVTISDKDNDLVTETDKILKIIDFNGNEKTIEEGTIDNLNMFKYKGNNILTWYNNQNINTIQNISSEINKLFNESKEMIVNNYTILQKDGNLVILYVAKTENGFGIYQLIQDENGNFGNPILIVDSENSINCYGANYIAEELLLVYTDTKVETLNDEITKSSKLYFKRIQDKFDIELAYIEYEPEEIIAYEENNISIYITNNAQIKSNNINVQILDDEGYEVYNENVKKEILPGNTEKIDLTGIYMYDSKNYTVIINEDAKEDYNLENNEKTFAVIHSDLDISADHVVTEDGNYALVTIKNNGQFDAEGISINILKQGETVEKYEIEENIYANDSKSVWVYVKNEYFEPGTNTLTFQVSTNTQELYLTNNTYSLTLVETENLYLLGDINFDGQVTSYDAHIVLKKLNEKSEFNEEEVKAADLVCDKVITEDDAIMILNYVANN